MPAVIGMEPCQHATNSLPNVAYNGFFREGKQHGPTEDFIVSLGIVKIFTSRLSFPYVIFIRRD